MEGGRPVDAVAGGGEEVETAGRLVLESGDELQIRRGADGVRERAAGIVGLGKIAEAGAVEKAGAEKRRPLPERKVPASTRAELGGFGADAEPGLDGEVRIEVPRHDRPDAGEAVPAQLERDH